MSRANPIPATRGIRIRLGVQLALIAFVLVAVGAGIRYMRQPALVPYVKTHPLAEERVSGVE